MSQVLLYRLVAPMATCGISANRDVQLTGRYPLCSSIAGFLGSALGIGREYHGTLQRLQDAMAYAVRADRPGEILADFQTTDLTALPVDVHTERGLFTRSRGRPAVTNLKDQQYLTDIDMLIGVRLLREVVDADGHPITLERLGQALQQPHWPLHAGKRNCPLSMPPYIGVVEAASAYAAVARYVYPAEPACMRPRHPEEHMPIWWSDNDAPGQGKTESVHDRKTWMTGAFGTPGRMHTAIIPQPTAQRTT